LLQRLLRRFVAALYSESLSRSQANERLLQRLLQRLLRRFVAALYSESLLSRRWQRRASSPANITRITQLVREQKAIEHDKLHAITSNSLQQAYQRQACGSLSQACYWKSR
jgi:hypothetical protein